MPRSADNSGRLYFLFKACEDGCLPCVKKLIEEEGLDPNQRSSSDRYAAIDYVEWGRSWSWEINKYDEVAAYLRTRASPSS